MGPRAGLDGLKFSSSPGFDPGPYGGINTNLNYKMMFFGPRACGSLFGSLGETMYMRAYQIC